MQIIPLKTPLIRSGDDLVSALLEAVSRDAGGLKQNDILVVSSKVVAMSEGNLIDLATINITDEARQWMESLRRENDEPAFRQAVLNETKRMNGNVIGGCKNAMLTELKPDGLEEGVIFAINAGLDRSNCPEGTCIGWPKDPVESVHRIRRGVAGYAPTVVLLSDSTCLPRRVGVVGTALTVSGMDPHHSDIGTPDLFGREMLMTVEATAHQLATAANTVMGNNAQSCPAALIRDHHIPLSDFEGWVPGIEPEEDLFQGLI